MPTAGVAEWLTTPPPDPTLGGIAPLYGGAVALALSFAAVAELLSGDETEWGADLPENFTEAMVVGGLAAPVFEEVLFRGTALAVADWTGASLALTVGVGTALWAMLHGKRWLFVLPTGIVFHKLWLAGVAGGETAILLHILHNSAIIAIVFGVAYALRWTGRRDPDVVVTQVGEATVRLPADDHEAITVTETDGTTTEFTMSDITFDPETMFDPDDPFDYDPETGALTVGLDGAEPRTRTAADGGPDAETGGDA